MSKRVASCLAAAAAVLLLAVGCSTGGQPQAAATPSTVTVTATQTETEVSRVTRTSEVEVSVTVTVTEAGAGGGGASVNTPEGYDDWGGGIATKWSEDADFECAPESDICWGVELYTDVACPAGVYIALDLMKGDTKVDVLDATTSPRPAGEYVSLVLGQTTTETDLTANIAEVRCSG